MKTISDPINEARRAVRRELARNGLGPVLGAPVRYGVPREENGRVSRSHLRNGGSLPRAFSPDSVFRKVLRASPAIKLGIIGAPPAPPFFRVARIGGLSYREFIAMLTWFIGSYYPECWVGLFDVASDAGVAIAAIDSDLALDVAHEALSEDCVARITAAIDNPSPDIAELRQDLSALLAVWGRVDEQKTSPC